MASAVIMPQGGQDIETGRVVGWLKDEGDPVKKGEVICEVETEKTVLEVTAPEDGVLLRIVVPEGNEARILTPIGFIGQPGEEIEGGDRPAAAEREAQHAPAVTAETDRARDSRYLAEEPVKIRVSPKAKKIAREKGVPLHLITGTGPQGRIISDDVLRTFQELQSLPEPQEVETLAGDQVEGGRVVPMSRAGRIAARRLQDSKRHIPHFYVTISVDMTEASRFRDEFNRRVGVSQGEKLSFTDLIVRATALAMKACPQINTTVKDEENLIIWDDINLGIAVATDSGLVVPVLENADRLPLEDMAMQLRRIAQMARDGRQSAWVPARLTISNLGMFNVDNFIAIINPPEAAILAISSIKKRLVVYDNGTIAARDMMNMTLSLDHRVGDGVLAARFLNEIRALLEQPELLR